MFFLIKIKKIFIKLPYDVCHIGLVLNFAKKSHKKSHKMKKIFTSFAALLLMASVSFAQDAPKAKTTEKKQTKTVTKKDGKTTETKKTETSKTAADATAADGGKKHVKKTKTTKTTTATSEAKAK